MINGYDNIYLAWVDGGLPDEMQKAGDYGFYTSDLCKAEKFFKAGFCVGKAYVKYKQRGKSQMKDFLNKTWVTVVGWIGLFVCAALLILGGTSVAEIGEGVELVAGIIQAVILAIAFIRKQINKKKESK